MTKDSGTRTGEDESCRRDQTDRRRKHFRAAVIAPFVQRRHGPRRDHELDAPHYVDVHEPWVLLLVLLTILLCVADAFFTLTILGLGGEEVNPFMRHLLETDVLLFFVVKFVMTSFGLVFTVIHKNFRIFRMISGYHIIYGVFVMYAVLIYYEIILLI